MNLCDYVTLFKPQEGLANGKVSARQQCVYEGPLAKKSTKQPKEHNVEKYIQWVTYSVAILICLAVVATQIYEILQKFELISVQGHPRSLILVSVESAA